jgi:chorismate-pyruvate lyase
VRASTSATAVLQRRCPGATIRAAVDRTARVPPTADQRARLRVGAGEAVAYRRVRLMCGTVAVSAAENWYVPARLTPAMRTALDGEAPFGMVIRSLRPTRTVVSVDRLTGDPVLRVRALVVGADGTPLAEVVENYTRAALK